MAWDWLGPANSVLAAGITAGIGGWLGSRQSRRSQERQQKFERDKELSEQGREKAREAIAALRYLQRHRKLVAAWNSPAPEGELSPDREQHDRLGEAIEYLNDEAVRQQIGLVYEILEDAWVLTSFGKGDHGEPQTVIWRCCQEGRSILGRYLRGEKTQEPSNFLREVRNDYDSAHVEIERQYSEWEASRRAKEPDSS
ncbi:hypothetical protein [Allokutzneria oryzae]|uniref:DUF4760 domain-containing protein n=1 Tax=Allokutzneria oryzae TaxID=1378989 RepID=A0ABV6A8Z9_9PSEU